MVKRLLVLLALLVVIIPGVSGAQAAMLAPTVIGGSLVSESTTSGATTFVVSTKNHGQVTVNITPTTKFVRRYNGLSALDELSLNDTLVLHGAFAVGTTTVFTATRVKDASIQEAATRAVLKVTGVSTTTTTSSFTATVLHDATARIRPFDEGATVTVTVSTSGTPMTKVMMWSSGNLVAGTFANIQAGQKVTVLGVYNRKLHTYIQTNFVHIHA